MKIIKQNEKSEDVTALAQIYNVRKQMVLKNKQKLETFVSSADTSKCIANCKSFKGSLNSKN